MKQLLTIMLLVIGNFAIAQQEINISIPKGGQKSRLMTKSKFVDIDASLALGNPDTGRSYINAIANAMAMELAQECSDEGGVLTNPKGIMSSPGGTAHTGYYANVTVQGICEKQ